MSLKNLKIGVIGATGIVGKELMKFLPLKNVECFASKKRLLSIKNTKILVEPLENIFKKQNFDILFFCAGKKVSESFIPQLMDKASIIIDASSFFRMQKDIPLIIPEINGNMLYKKHSLIASPNCTTTLMLMPLHNLHKKYKIKRIIASSYQAASGGGRVLTKQLKEDTLKYFKGEQAFYGFNLFLHRSDLNEEKYSKEEEKMEKEAKKILNDNSIKISATCVRVPIFRAHSISANVEFKKKVDLQKAYEIIKNSENVEIFEDYEKKRFATPLDASFKNHVLCSRIRMDRSKKNTLEFWIVGDQLLKGAAYNLFQIAELRSAML